MKEVTKEQLTEMIDNTFDMISQQDKEMVYRILEKYNSVNKVKKKYCEYCDQLLFITDFYKKQGRCKKCRNLYMKMRKNQKKINENPEKTEKIQLN